MCVLFVPEAAGDQAGWCGVVLAQRAYSLGTPDGRLLAAAQEACAAVLLPGRGAGRGARWVLVVRPGAAVSVSGEPVAPLGIRVLAHRDAIQLPDATLFYSSEALARVEPCPAEVGGLRCPRCTTPLLAGDRVVRCPSCGAWHHQSEQRECWTYAEHCMCCPQPTALGDSLQWVPEGE